MLGRPSASLPHFKDIGPQAGLGVSHVSSHGKWYTIESVSGGIGLIDCDNDGKLDIVAVHGSKVDRYRKQGGDPRVTLYRQDANLGWGTAFLDMDHDGWLDIFAANGHVYPQVDTIPNAAHFRQPVLLFRNPKSFNKKSIL